MIHLTPRQKMIAGLIRPGQVLADIGTDHARLPVALLQQGRIPFAYCTDVRQGPLDNARATIEQCGMSNKTRLVLCNGFEGLVFADVHDFVVAGMGGVLTVELFKSAPWLKDFRNHFVLQPQSHMQEVRRYLFENGYEIVREAATLDHHRPYTAMEVIFTGDSRDFTLADCYIGKMREIEDASLKNRFFVSLSHYLEDQIQGKPYNVSELEEVLKQVKECIE